MQLTSTAFDPGGPIPATYTCDGQDLSPPLAWSDVPEGTAALALLVDDPDVPDPKAPKRVWVHWIAYNIPPSLSSLAEGIGNRAPAGPMRFATTDAGTTGYHGPCPPIGRHRYFFRLYALDVPLKDLGAGARRLDFDAALAGHVLGTAVLMGTYAHPGKS